MKSLFLISFLLTSFLWPSVSLAADSGTCVDAGNPAGFYYDGSELTGDEVLVHCTSAVDKSLSVTLSGTDAKNALMRKLSGWWHWQIVSYPGATAPTDNTDLEITEQMTATIGLSLLGAYGTDFIDATTAKETVFYNTFISTPTYRKATMAHPWTISTTGNDVASADFYLLFRRDRQ